MQASESSKGRLPALIGAGLLHGLMLLALLLATPPLMTPSSETMRMFDVATDQPHPIDKVEADGVAPEKTGDPGERAEPAQIVAPEPEIALEAPSTIAAAPIAGPGLGASSGAAAGPGTGAGGTGDGRGGGGGIVRASWASGRITPRDYPRAAAKARAQGTATVRFTVDASGRPKECRVMQSSGHDMLDAATCRLVEERFHYTPARDGSGRAIEDVAGWRQRWWLE